MCQSYLIFYFFPKWEKYFKDKHKLPPSTCVADFQIFDSDTEEDAHKGESQNKYD